MRLWFEIVLANIDNNIETMLFIRCYIRYISALVSAALSINDADKVFDVNVCNLSYACMNVAHELNHILMNRQKECRLCLSVSVKMVVEYNQRFGHANTSLRFELTLCPSRLDILSLLIAICVCVCVSLEAFKAVASVCHTLYGCRLSILLCFCCLHIT